MQSSTIVFNTNPILASIHASSSCNHSRDSSNSTLCTPKFNRLQSRKAITLRPPQNGCRSRIRSVSSKVCWGKVLNSVLILCIVICFIFIFNVRFFWGCVWVYDIEWEVEYLELLITEAASVNCLTEFLLSFIQAAVSVIYLINCFSKWFFLIGQ